MQRIEIDYEKSEEIVEAVATWLEEHTRKVRRWAYAFCASHRHIAILAQVHSVLNRLRKQPRLVMRSTCPGCNPKYWEGR